MANNNQRRNNNPRAGRNAQQGNQGGNNQAAQPHANAAAGGNQQQPQRSQQQNQSYRVSLSELSEANNTVTMKFLLNHGNAVMYAGVPVNLFVNGNPVTSVSKTNGDGEAEYVHQLQPGEKALTVEVIAKVPGDPSQKFTYVVKNPIPIPVPEAKPKTLQPFAIGTDERFGDDENHWYAMVGAKVTNPNPRQSVTFNGRIRGTEPANPNLSQIVRLDVNGTAYADFEFELEVPFANILVSTKGQAAQTVRIERPKLNAAIHAWVSSITLLPTEAGTFQVQLTVEGKVLHDIWRNNRRVSVWTTGAAQQFVRTHDGLFTATFVVNPELVPDLGDLMHFGALLVGTDADCKGSVLLPDWKPAANTLAHGIARQWWNWRDFGSRGMTFRDHIRDVDSSLHSVMNCSIMLLVWAAMMFAIHSLTGASFWTIPLPAYGIAWLLAVCYWWLVEDIMHQRRRIYLFAWSFAGLIVLVEGCWWVLWR